MKGFIARSSSFRRVSQIFSDVYTSKFSLSVLHVHLQVLVKEKMFAVKFGKENHNIELASGMRLKHSNRQLFQTASAVNLSALFVS